MNKKIAIAFFLLLFCLSPFFSQASSFPGASVRGSTDLSTQPPARIPFINFEIREPETNNEVAFSLQLLLGLTILSLAPSILLLVTSFLRISIVLDFIKRALSLQQVPPTQVLNGIALFITLAIMWPTFTAIYNNSIYPITQGEISVSEAITQAEEPIRTFMLKQMTSETGVRYVKLFGGMAGYNGFENSAAVPTHILIPAYILNELTIAFKIGILLYIPFIVIDMIVASILMSMGMIMLPPVQISMPFKLILFILVDGWGLLTQQLFNSFTP